MKYLLTFILCLFGLSALGQYRPNYYDTNAAPVISPSGSNAVNIIISTNRGVTNIVYSMLPGYRTNQFTTNIVGLPVIGNVTFTNSVIASNLTAKGGAYMQGSSILCGNTGIDLDTTLAPWNMATGRFYVDTGAPGNVCQLTWSAINSRWELYIYYDVPAKSGTYIKSDGYLRIIEGTYDTYVSGDDMSVELPLWPPIVFGPYLPPGIVFTNSTVAYGSIAINDNPIHLTNDIAYLNIRPNQILMRGSSGGWCEFFNPAGTLGQVTADIFGADEILDFSDNGYAHILVLNHALLDGEGTKPWWFVHGSLIVTNSIIATNAFGTNDISLPYAQYSATNNQVVASTTITNIVVFTDVEAARRITPLTDTGTWSKTYIQEAGTYLIIVSAITDLNGACGSPPCVMNLWLAVNGVIGTGGSVPRSNTRVSVNDQNSEHTLAVSFVYTFAQGDYFELWYAGNDTDLMFRATAAGGTPTMPLSPSVIMTVNKISSFP